MSNSAAEESPHKKRKTCPPPSPISLLPDEMVLSCMSRVSRSDQAALSLVSRSYHSLLASPDLYKMRSLFGCTENCLYVCLLSPPDPTPRWFILLRANRLLSPIPIPSFPSQAPEGSSVVALDWGIYVIGGLLKGKKPSSDVLLLDCRTHTWRQVPSMGVGRVSAAAGVVGGKIYVFGGCYDPDSSNWAEVYDPKTQTWDALPPAMLDRKTRCQIIHDSVVVKEEKFYAVDLMERTFYYSPSESKWGRGNHSELRGYKRDWCVIDKIIYSCDRFGELCWCEQVQLECSEPEGMYWRKVQGLGSLKESLSSSRLLHFDGRIEGLWEFRKIGFGVDYKMIDVHPGARLSKSGPNLVLFWDVIEGDHLKIWCAEISLERRQGAEIWGNIEWSHPVMTVEPFLHHYKVLHSLSITL